MTAAAARPTQERRRGASLLALSGVHVGEPLRVADQTECAATAPVLASS